MVINRMTKTTNHATSTTGQTAVAHPIVAVEGSVEHSTFRGTQSGAGSMVLFVAASGLTITPVKGDTVVDGADKWTVDRVGRVKPGSIPILYELLVIQ
jgi:hypothetical protein